MYQTDFRREERPCITKRKPCIVARPLVFFLILARHLPKFRFIQNEGSSSYLHPGLCGSGPCPRLHLPRHGRQHRVRPRVANHLFAFSCIHLRHIYIYRPVADSYLFPLSSYPGWDVRLDATLDPTPDRIAYGGGGVGPVTDADNPEIACNYVHNPAPGAIAEVRAGSDVTFHWSHWLYSHKGPITAWMAPYEGYIADVDVNELGFIKFAEDAIDENGIWANVRMMDDTNGTWTATIPADIKPGNYVIRQEVR